MQENLETTEITTGKSRIEDGNLLILLRFCYNIKHKALAQLYDPDKMPNGLKEAHKANDIVIEKCYRSKPFETDEERLEYLFKLYEKMIAEEESE